MSQFLLWHSQSNDISVKETIPKCLSYFITSSIYIYISFLYNNRK